MFQKATLSAVVTGLLLFGAACGSDNNANTNDAGGGGGGGGAGGATSMDPGKFGFENGMTDGWRSGGTAPDVFTTVMSSPAQKFAGEASLAAAIEAPAAAMVSYSVEVDMAPPVAMAAGTIVTFHIYLPADAPIDWIQPFIQEETSFMFWGKYTGGDSLVKGAWNHIMLPVDPGVTNAIYKMGVQFHNNQAWNGTVYVDSVAW